MLTQRSRIFALIFLPPFVMTARALPPPPEEPADTAAVSRIREEGMLRSKVMETLEGLVDGHGARLTGSPAYDRAAAWCRDRLAEWGLEHSRLEAWGPFGRGWSLLRYSAHVTEPEIFPLISYPEAWSPGTGGMVHGEVIAFNPESDSALGTFRGRLKGKFVLTGEPRTLTPGFKPRATRETEASLLDLANADVPRARRRRASTPEREAEWRRAVALRYQRDELCRTEGALAMLSPSWGDGGNVVVTSARASYPPGTPDSLRYPVYDRRAPAILPQVSVSAEQYNRLHRLLERGVGVRLEMRLDVEAHDADSVSNVIAEIPGSDLADEVVMIGAHLDSWHGGTGTTDNGTGVATCMEAMRILKALNLTPRRTIRIGLWAGEEEGLLGSEAYVAAHLGRKEGRDSSAVITLTPAGEKFSVYFNNDNGTGKVRGVFMQGNEAVRPIFRSWLKPFEKDGAATLTLSNTSSTDHISFDALGIPAFQFIQDDIEYFTLTWHSTMDVYERAIEDDLKFTAVILATFAYNAAMRDARIPRKEKP